MGVNLVETMGLNDGQKQLWADVCSQDFQVSQSKVLSNRRQIWGQ